MPFHQREQPADQWPPSVRTLLFDEALDPRPVVRRLARAAISSEVTWGGDVTNEAFAARHGMPIYGSVGLHVFGWQRKLSVPPYENRAVQVFIRLDNVRGKIPHDDRWFKAQAEAEVRFWQTGELPEDALHLETLLVRVEIDLLRAHKRGKDVAKAMAMFDRIARAEGDLREDLLEEMSEFVPALCR